MGRVHRNKSESEVEDLGKKTRGTTKSIPYGIDLDIDEDWNPQNNRFRQSKHVPNDKRNQVGEHVDCIAIHFCWFSLSLS